MLSILAAALHLGLIVGLGKRLFLAREVWPRAIGSEVELQLLITNARPAVLAVGIYLPSVDNAALPA